MDEACCTCALLMRNIVPEYDEKSEKPKAQDRRLECCDRVICGNCISKNRRFATYCPYCQVSIVPSPLPQGLRDPPSYQPSSSAKQSSHPPSYVDDLPSYASLTNHQAPPPEKSSIPPAEDVLHFLDHENDSITSLAFRYNVPLAALRKANNLTSDHLLMGRRTVVIPGEYYKGGVSLSPRPIEGEDEERRKAIVRRWMMSCKVSDYDIALLYLEQTDYDLDAAIELYRDDERWEKEHPMKANVKGKGKTRQDVGKRRYTGQTN
ncbi:hypothetical protein B0O99DRAFT_143876 [Bisporella sp. PMI_857]|nr:hypothetical protein B0O99DRAFT_143876 [Bisporella sp. PMI_857]